MKRIEEGKTMSSEFRSNFTFGSPVAESDHLLSVAYWDNGDFEAISSRVDFRRFIIGRTGSGKSAIFKQIEERYPRNFVRIIPENLSLPYITNLDVTRQLLQLGVRLEPFFKALWKHVFLVEIIKHRYKIDSPEKKMNIFTQLINKLRNDSAKVRALEYLDEFGDKFWADTNERVQQIAEIFETKIKSKGNLESELAAFGLKAGANAGSESETTSTTEIKREIADRYQKVVNETQLPRLNEMIVILNNEILESDQHFTYLMIDDLDKEWVDENLANQLIRCLFEAVLDMTQVKNLKIIVALRSNIFQQLNYGEQIRGAQEEKFRSHSLHVVWNRRNLQGLLEARALAASNFYRLDPPKTLEDILPRGNKSVGDAIDYILKRTLMRPRDAISYLNACFREAIGKERMTWENMRQAEKIYSQDRLLALRDEWKDPYFEVDKFFNFFRNKSSQLSRSDLAEILNDVALLIADEKFQGTTWLTPMCENIWAGDKDKTWEELYAKLTDMLFTIGFLGYKKARSNDAIYSYDDIKKVNSVNDIRTIEHFEIHPAFLVALDITQQDNVN
jgi:hypothetical protein